MVWQLEAYGALKLFILRSEGEEWGWRTRRREGGVEGNRVKEVSVGKYGWMVAG